MNKFVSFCLGIPPMMVVSICATVVTQQQGSTELQEATKKLEQVRIQAEVEPEIQTLITTKAEELLITELSKPPINLGNVTNIHQILSHFNALQAYNLTNEYNKLMKEIIQKAIQDQYRYNYRNTLPYDKYKAIMEQKAISGLIKFVEKVKVTLETIRETGTPTLPTADTLPPLLGASRLEGELAQLQTEIKIRKIIETHGELVMITELAKQPIQLGNLKFISQILDHFNALQAYPLTEAYKTIIERLSQSSIAEYQTKEYMRIINEATLKVLLEKRVHASLKTIPYHKGKPYLTWVKESLEMIRETGKMPSNQQ